MSLSWAPELPHTMKTTKQSDVYSFGMLALEVAFYDARSSAEESFIQDFVWDAHERGDLVCVADERLLKDFDSLEMRLVLSLGLLCGHLEPNARPSMRFVHQCIIGEALPLPLPLTRAQTSSNQLSSEAAISDV